MKRRRFLRLSTVGAVCTVIAGCLEDEQEPGDSYEVTIGTSESTADVLFQAEDAADVETEERRNTYDVIISFAEDQAEEIQQTAVDLGDDLFEATLFEYLDDELIGQRSVGNRAERMHNGEWAEDEFRRRFRFSYLEEEVMNSVAATVREYSEN